jgi:hypothetical protein
MSWNPVDDSQTPNWGAVLPAGAFQPYDTNGNLAFQPYDTNGHLAFQVVGGTAVWTPVNDTQTPGWGPVP